MVPPRQRARSTVKGLTYDAGALIAYEKRDSTMMGIHDSAVEHDITPVVPAGVLAQAWKGGSGTQAPLARMLKQCRVEPLDESLAKQVGAASEQTVSNDVVDISVVISAVSRGDEIVTSDLDDIYEIMTSLGYNTAIYEV